MSVCERESKKKRMRAEETVTDRMCTSEGKKQLCIWSGQPSTWLSPQQYYDQVCRRWPWHELKFIFNLKTNFSLLRKWLLQKVAPQIHEWVTGRTKILVMKSLALMCDVQQLLTVIGKKIMSSPEDDSSVLLDLISTEMDSYPISWIRKIDILLDWMGYQMINHYMK